MPRTIGIRGGTRGASAASWRRLPAGTWTTPRDADEDRRPRAPQIGDERAEALGEVDAHAARDRRNLDGRTLENVCEGQVGEHPVVAGDPVLLERAEAGAQRPERVHDPFGRPGAARRVHDGG